jgi:hypothetical protein
MKKMKTTIAATVALAACVGTQLLAQNTKQDTITMALTLNAQASVSTSATVANAGNFSQGPLYYKIAPAAKFTQANILEAIAIVMHGNPKFYSSSATLELVQGELGGFWNINDGLAQSFPDYYTTPDPIGNLSGLTGSFNDDGSDGANPYYGTLRAVFFPDIGPYDWYGEDSTYVPFVTGQDFDDRIPNFVDDFNAPPGFYDPLGKTSIADGVNEYARLDTGRHFLPVPWMAYDPSTETGTPYPTTGEYPPGHMQPWGQIYVRDPKASGFTADDPLCENVTFFFDLEVQECYDCFYLNSFITTATFKSVPGVSGGPPCCGSENILTGTGVDYYYLTLDFDNTLNNSFLNPALETNDDDDSYYVYNWVGFTGVIPNSGEENDNGLSPDILEYSDKIKSDLEGLASPYETRFTLNGIVTYHWALKLINKSDVAADYIGTAPATYVANGYGFIGLVCQLITGTVTFTEKSVPDVGCCDDQDWWDDEFNDFSTGDTYYSGWFGPGWTGGHGYFNPDFDQYNPYPYYNIVGGEIYDTDIADEDLPYQHESPLNPAAALTDHLQNYGSSSVWTYDFDTYIDRDIEEPSVGGATKK